MRTRARREQSQSGIAIIIVLISIFVLTMLAGGFAYSMKVETRLAQNANSEAELEWLGRSGVEYARWVLAEQLKIPQEPYDALNQVWAGGPGGIGTSNSPLAEVQREVHLGNGKFTWKIIDLERKANINVADQTMLSQALGVIGVDAGEQTPAGSILDWIDPDDSTHPDGAENDYYHSLNPPYDCKNGPIDDLSELLFVKGITPELYWGDFSTNHPPAAFQGRVNKFGQQITYPFGLVDLFTPLSDGRININTASAEVLQLVPGVTPQIAQAIVSGREGDDDGSGLLGPYKSVQGVERVPEVPRGMGGMLQSFCDIRSRTFEVTVDAEVGGYHRQFIAVLGRNNPRDIQILSFYWK
jgi:general secretion pathway protein K